MEEKEEKEVYRERPDLVEALKGKYFCPFLPSKYGDGYESELFAEIKAILEVIGGKMVKLTLRLVSFCRTQNYNGITAETKLPWFVSKNNADDELTAEMVVSKMEERTRTEFTEFARKTLNQSLQVLEDMGISKEEILR